MTHDRIEVAEKHLDRMHSFFGRIDAKLTAVASWLFVQLAVVALNTKWDDLSHTQVWVPFFGYAICSSVAARYLWKCIFPESKGGDSSLIYFGEIARRTEANFIKEYRAMTTDQLLDDLAGQIWRNAEIVRDKYQSVQSGIRWTTAAMGFELTTLTLIGWLHHTLPHLPGGG